MRPALLLPLALGVVVLASSCAGTRGAGRDGPDLDGRTFLSTEVRGHTLVDGSVVTLAFSDGRVSASAGCNSMSGAATWDDGLLDVEGDGLATTMIGCPPELQAQDEWLADLITSRPALVLSGSTLEIGDAERGITFAEQEDATLLGTVWTVDGLVTRDAVSSLPEGVEASLTFTDDGRVAVRAGCNSGSGPVEVDAAAGTIGVGGVMTTRMMCSPEAMAVEQHVLAVLTGTVTFRIGGPSLSLTAGENGLVLRAAT